MAIALGRTHPFEQAAGASAEKRSSFPFFLVLIYLFLEFGRPQNLIPLIDPLHLPRLVLVLIALMLLYSAKPRIIDRSAGLFLLFILLMTLHGPFVTNHYEALQTWKTMVLTFIGYLGIAGFAGSPERFRMLIHAWLGIHAFLAITGVVLKGRGIGGFLGDENDFCMVLNMVLPFPFFLALSEERKSIKALFFALTGLFLFANVLTFSRGGFVGLVAVGGYCWLRSPNRLLTALLILVLSLFLLAVAPESYWEEIKTIRDGTQTPTGEGRVYLWKYGWKMFLDNPILGVGQGNFPYDFAYYEGDDRLHGASRAGRAAHSLYFTLLPELGLAGTVLFLTMVLGILKDLRLARKLARESRLDADSPAGAPASGGRRVRFLTFAIEASLIGYLASGLFISVLYYPCFWLLMGFAAALKNSLMERYEGSSPPPH